MKILISYYSRTGHTEKVAKALEAKFKGNGHSVDIEVIVPAKIRKFWGWWNLRLFKKECDIVPPKIKDVSGYDLICIGSPNWTRLSLPVSRYLKTIEGLKYKNVGFFATTALLPQIEWYIFSAFFFDYSFAQIISQKEGRIIDNLFLSSLFKKWNYSSSYGKEKINSFCDNMERLRYSFKDYHLKERETNISRVSLMIFSIFLVVFCLWKIFEYLSGRQALSQTEFLSMFAIGIFSYFSILTILADRKTLFLTKYIVCLSLLSGVTIVIFFVDPFFGRIFLGGYALVFVLSSFFYDTKVLLFSGVVSLAGYFFLFSNYPAKEFFYPLGDVIFIVSTTIIMGAVTNNLKKTRLELLEARDEAEMAKASLEIKITARTRELRELSQSLETQVDKRTEELKEKIGELERFNRLAVGRELKMIKLKKEIKDLKSGGKEEEK